MHESRTRAQSNAIRIYSDSAYCKFVEDFREYGKSEPSLVLAAQPAGAYPHEATSELWVGLQVSGRGNAVFDLGSGPRSAMIEPGDILVRKPNVSSFYQFDHTHRFLLVSLPMTEEILQLSSAFGYPELDFGILHEHKLSDPFLASMLTQLWYGMLSGYVDPYHYLGAAAPMIVAEMASCSVRLSRKSRGGLSPGNKRRIIEFLHFNLEKRITVEMMAKLAGLSQHYFVRAFKESFGIPPHQYLVQQRLAKARTLITESTQPLDAIAEMTGFSGHGAMSRAFKLAGLPPPNRHRRNP